MVIEPLDLKYTIPFYKWKENTSPIINNSKLLDVSYRLKV